MKYIMAKELATSDRNDECIAQPDMMLSCLCKSCMSSYIDHTIGGFYKQYSEKNEPIQVDFRKLVSWVPYNDSYTHYIHKYPAKLIKHIPIFFLNSNKILPNRYSTVVDPFCGSGTVLLEAMLSGHNSIGFDANPLARAISRVKTNPINPIKLYAVTDTVITKAKRLRKHLPLKVVNIDHWFPPHVQRDLSRLKRAIDTIEQSDVKDFFQVTFSAILKKSSYADPNLSVPVKLKPEKFNDPKRRADAQKKIDSTSNMDVFEEFKTTASSNIKRMESLYCKDLSTESVIWGNDARDLKSEEGCQLPDNSVDCILTSPPYAGAQKYIRSSSLNLGWLGHCEDKTLRYYEEKNIGREHYHKAEYIDVIETGFKSIDNTLTRIRNLNPLRAHINGNYLLEMRQSLSEMYRVLKKSSHCIIVIGNNNVCGLPFETQSFIREIAEEIGFKHQFSLIDDITSRGLMTKRNKTANIINSEWVLVFRK